MYLTASNTCGDGDGVSTQTWLAPGTGLADDFFFALKGISSDPSIVMLAAFAIFAVVHSGLAALRPQGTGLHPIIEVSHNLFEASIDLFKHPV